MKIILALLLLIPALTFAEEKKLLKKCKQKPGTNMLECKMVEEVAGVDKFSGRFEIPEDANPNYPTLKYYLNNYFKVFYIFICFFNIEFFNLFN